MADDKVNYFIAQTNERLEIIDRKLDTLLAFKWQIIGGSVVVSAIFSTAISILIAILGGH